MTIPKVAQPTAGLSTASGVPSVSGWYLYGVVRSSASIPDGLKGIGSNDAQITVAKYESVAAVVSPLSENRALGSRRDVLTHARVLDGLVLTTPVLPARFGVVLPNPVAVIEELLTPRHNVLVSALTELAGRVQFTVSVRQVTEVVLHEILAEEPEILRLRELVAGGMVDRDLNFRLGELVAHALARKREVDTDLVRRALVAHAVAWVVRPATSEDEVVTSAFLVEQAERAGFEQAAEELASLWADRARVRMLGPLAPYDFADSLISEPQ